MAHLWRTICGIRRARHGVPLRPADNGRKELYRFPGGGAQKIEIAPFIRLQDMIKRGMTLEQIKAAKPTQDFDPIYGKNDGNWTTDMFIEAAYKSLTGKPDAHASGK
jgi:hypothetical protein